MESPNEKKDIMKTIENYCLTEKFGITSEDISMDNDTLKFMMDNATLINKIEKINLILSNESQKSFFDKYYEKLMNYKNPMLLYVLQNRITKIINDDGQYILEFRDYNDLYKIKLYDTSPLTLYINNNDIIFNITNSLTYTYSNTSLFSCKSDKYRLYEPKDEKLVRNFFKTLKQRDQEMEDKIINYLNSKM